ncbi:MAG: hypothetical protein WDM96_11425 [Lacunisphaera sp.]
MTAPSPVRWLAGFAASALLAGAAEPARLARPALRLDAVPLLFADDSGVLNRSGVVRTIHAARTRAAPVLAPETPWEGDRVYIYGSVLRDAGTGAYRMWYQGRPEPEGTKPPNRAPALRGGGFDPVLQATSADGVHWTRPALGLYAFDGSTANNIVFELHSPAVLLDRFEPDAAKRYKLIGSTMKGYRVAYSADGLHWTEYPDNPVLPHYDTVTLAQDPRTGEYLAYHKRPHTERGYYRRAVWLSRSMDFQHWSEPQLVFSPDATDDEWATRTGERTEVYKHVRLPARRRIPRAAHDVPRHESAERSRGRPRPESARRSHRRAAGHQRGRHSLEPHVAAPERDSPGRARRV